MNESIAQIEVPVDVDKLDTAKPLSVIFAPFQTTLEKWEAKVASLTVTDISQKTEMAQARLARLELKAARVGVEKTRVGLVENLKARTGKIDEVARTIRKKIEGLEATLLESEEFAERHAAKLREQLKLDREKMLSAYSEGPILGDLSDLSANAFVKMLEDAKFLRQAKLDAAAKAEAERLAKIEADRLERERLHAEYERVKAEAAEAARVAEIERQRMEIERAEERKKAQAELAKQEEIAKKEKAEALAKAKAESDRLTELALQERQRLEAKARKDAEEAELAAKAEASARALERRRLEVIAADERKKAQAEAAEAAKVRAELAAREREEAAARQRAEADRRAAAKAAREAAEAPDKAKLVAFAAMVRALPIPTLKTVDIDLPAMLEEFATRIERQAGITPANPTKPTTQQLALTP